MCVWGGGGCVYVCVAYVCVCVCVCVCAHVCIGVHLEHPSFGCPLDPVLSKPDPTTPPQSSLPTSMTTALLNKFSTSFVAIRQEGADHLAHLSRFVPWRAGAMSSGSAV